MFEEMPEDTMIGAQMGKTSGLFACDFDLYKAGAEDYMRYLIDKGLLTETQTHLTMSGGLHMIYRSDQQPNVKPAIGVEIKGEGGYVIVPPSNGYTIESTGIAQADPALIAELLRSQKQSSTSTVDHLKRQVLSGKAFHDPLAQIAARRSASGWSVEKVQRELLDVLGASAASAPSHPRHERWLILIEDRGEELSRIVGTGNEKFNSNAKTERAKAKVGSDTFNGLARDTSSFFNDRGSSDESEDEAGSSEPDEEDDVVGDWPFAASGYSASTRRDISSQKYIAYPFFAERESVLIAAEPKAGKTAIALTIAAAVASGTGFGDAIQIAEPRPVLYFTLEGARAVELRLEAMRVDCENDNKPEPELDKLFVIDRPHNFLEADKQTANCANIALHSAKCQQEWGVDLGLIVIDTLTKAMAGGDQNSVEDTSQMFEMIGKLREFGVDATIVFIHHLSKSGNVRGSTNIEAEVDVVLGVAKIKDSSDVWLNIRRARSIDDDTSYRWAFKNVDLGETVQGHKLSAPVMVLQGAEAPTGGENNARDNVRWAAICKALVTLGNGEHDVSQVVRVLHEYVAAPVGKRPNYFTAAVQTPLKEMFGKKFSWAFGEAHMTLLRNADESIKGIQIRGV